jgi:hypothetical protein
MAVFFFSSAVYRQQYYNICETLVLMMERIEHHVAPKYFLFRRHRLVL